jgi:hypothetical protein
MRLAIPLATILLALGVTACSDSEPQEPGSPTTTVAITDEHLEPSATSSLPTATAAEPSATPLPPPTEPPVTNRQDCVAIQGTSYLSEEERVWFQTNCAVQEPAQQQAPTQPPAQSCHPSYAGACLDPNASDYDCAGGSGNGPLYTGPVQIVGPDVFDLDGNDHDGLGCE